jgi:hypothetical protein
MSALTKIQVEIIHLIVTVLLVAATSWQATPDPLSVAIKVLLVLQAYLVAPKLDKPATALPVVDDGAQAPDPANEVVDVSQDAAAPRVVGVAPTVLTGTETR